MISPICTTETKVIYFSHSVSILDFLSRLELLSIELLDRYEEDDHISVLTGLKDIRSDLIHGISSLQEIFSYWQKCAADYYGLELVLTGIPHGSLRGKKSYASPRARKLKWDRRLLAARGITGENYAINDRLKAAMLAHHLLVGTEIPTLLCCSRLLLTPVKTPYDFALDICSQIADEARHAAFFYGVLHSNGYQIGSFYEDVSWVSAVLRQQPQMILAVHQRLGECIGVVAAQELALIWKEVGYQELAEGLKIIAIDELEHVKLGDRWISWFCDKDQERISNLLLSANAFRKNLGLGDGSHVANFSALSAVHISNNCKSLLGDYK